MIIYKSGSYVSKVAKVGRRLEDVNIIVIDFYCLMV